jgi:Flp pilus assembly protein TadG
MHRLRQLRARGRRSRSRGQSLAEFALALPILLLVLLIAIDFGRALQGYVVLQNVTRVGVNFAATHSSGWNGGPDDAAIQAEYAAIIADEGAHVDCVAAPTAVAPSFTDGPDSGASTGDVGDVVSVALSCNFQPLAPLIQAIVGPTVTLAARTDFIIRDGTIVGAATQPPVPPPATPTPTPTGGPTPTPTPTPPPCLVVPNLVQQAGGTETVGQARSEWQAAGFTGSFSPNGQNGKIVLSQSVLAGSCVAASTSVTVTHT